MAGRLLPSPHLELDLCSPAIKTTLSNISGARSGLLKGLETCSSAPGGLLNSDPVESDSIEVPMSPSEPLHSAEHVKQQAHRFHRRQSLNHIYAKLDNPWHTPSTSDDEGRLAT